MQDSKGKGPATKSQCTSQESRQLALMSMEQITPPGSAVYYTDGSVNLEGGRTGAAFVTDGLEWACRTSDYCSSLQAELVAILHALQHALHRPEETVVIHSDSRAGLQALQHTHP